MLGPQHSAREFLDQVGRVFGLNAPARVARTSELLELAGLADAASRRIGGFSRGMRQRLGLAQALISRPSVLFLDEPVSALDPAGLKDAFGLIERLRGEATVFMSNHILADVERVCDTVGILARGPLLTSSLDEATLQVLTTIHPVQRLGTSEEVATLIVFLTSDAAACITGSYHLVDGGYTAP